MQFHGYRDKRHALESPCNRLGAMLRRNLKRQISEINDSHRPGSANALTEFIIHATWYMGAGGEKLGFRLFRVYFRAIAKRGYQAYSRFASRRTAFRDAVGNDLGSFPPNRDSVSFPSAGILDNEAGAYFSRPTPEQKSGNFAGSEKRMPSESA